MKLSHPFTCFAVVAIFTATSGHTLAQSAQSAQSASSSAATPLAASNAKAVRAANRKLAHRVENALARTRGLNSARIIVTARDGRITLSGAVNYNEQIPLATDAARKVEGVTDVENRIRATGASL